MFTPPIGLCGLIWWLSSQPRAPVPEVNDKVAHVLVFGLLAALWVRAFRFTSDWSLARGALVATALSLGYGVIDELHQSFVPGRVASVLDGVADGVGAVAGALLASGLYALTQRYAPRGPRS